MDQKDTVFCDILATPEIGYPAPLIQIWFCNRINASTLPAICVAAGLRSAML
jgi:hypothetical protein